MTGWQWTAILVGVVGAGSAVIGFTGGGAGAVVLGVGMLLTAGVLWEWRSKR